MAKVDKLDENEVDPPRIIHDLGPPTRTRKRKRSGGNALLNVAGKKKRKRNRQGDAKKHLRLLRSDLAAESGQVRFSVVDEQNGTTIRQATHVTRSTANTVANTKTAPQHIPAAKSAASNHRHEHPKQYRQTVLPALVAKTTARLVPERKTGAAQAKSTVTKGDIPAVAGQPARPKNVVKTTKRTSVQSPGAALAVANSSSVRKPPPEDIIVIEDDPIALQPQVTPQTPAAIGAKSGVDIIKIDCSSSDSEKNSPDDSESDSDTSMASSSSCRADNEEHFGSDESEDDSDESDEEGKALFSRLVQVANRHFAKIRASADTQSDFARATATPSTPIAIKQASVPEIDDEETETE
ncbi:hypothetical protein V7S43_001620 [Phytophthora oleae]|uniref:Uncharacterized protein n=1 Tax=Phytophthora oleae TaxID=2107226 RepID=A0ABD3G482_9STRA